MSYLVFCLSVLLPLQCYKHRFVNSSNKLLLLLLLLNGLHSLGKDPGCANWFCSDSYGMVHSFRPKWLWPYIRLSVCLSQSARTSRNRQKERKQTNFRIHSSWSECQTDGLFHPDYPNLLNIEIWAAFFFPLFSSIFFYKFKLPEGVVLAQARAVLTSASRSHLLTESDHGFCS